MPTTVFCSVANADADTVGPYPTAGSGRPTTSVGVLAFRKHEAGLGPVLMYLLFAAFS